MKTNTFYLVKTVLEIENDNGKIQKIKENYLVKAVSCIDAETKLHQHFKDNKLTYTIVAISESKIIDILE